MWIVLDIVGLQHNAQSRSAAGSRSDGSAEPDFEAQARLGFANLEATLRAGGCGLEDIVDVTAFHTDPENQFRTAMSVNGEVFPKAPYPKWTEIGVNWLAGFDFEITVMARIPVEHSRDRADK